MHDNYRPSQHQITHHYTCAACKFTAEYFSDQHIDDKCPSCQRYDFRFSGESYPASSDDWEEQRDPDGEWRSRRY